MEWDVCQQEATLQVLIHNVYWESNTHLVELSLTQLSADVSTETQWKWKFRDNIIKRGGLKEELQEVLNW